MSAPTTNTKILNPPTLTLPESAQDFYKYNLEIWNRTGGFTSAITNLKGLVASVSELNTLVGIHTDDTVQQQLNEKEPGLGSGTVAQYLRGDKTWQNLTTTVVPEGTNLYYTDLRARSAISNTATGLTYLNGVFSLTSGYVIPTVTEETNWNNTYSTVNLATSLGTPNTLVLRDANANASFNSITLADTLTLTPLGAAPLVPAEGMMYVDNTAGNHLYIYLNAGWVLII